MEERKEGKTKRRKKIVKGKRKRRGWEEEGERERNDGRGER